MRTLNLGILAHVDAGKTTLTERLLYAAGVIDEIGSVDEGSTQTDSLPLERRRGITIRSAVVSFVVDDVVVNLIDTPGHPDFIAEVERVLNVLDGAVLVVSAVEGVQPQTRVLMRTLQRLRIPTLIFVNKIDRAGADVERVLHGISERLTPAITPMGTTHDLGTRSADFTPHGAADGLRDELARRTAKALVHPVFFGSAITGAGVTPLMAGITGLLPATEGEAQANLSATVFKIERGPAGEKIAYVRVFSGTIRTRDRLAFGSGDGGKVTAIRVFDRGSDVKRASVVAGQIGKLWGLADVRIGDTLGQPRTTSDRHRFAPPTLETVVVPRRPADGGALHAALTQLAEQDPLIDLRQDDLRHELFVSLYGEVQKEVIQSMLADDYGIDVGFRETTMICIERPIGTGAALEAIDDPDNPFLATVGLRVEPGAVASGVAFRLEVPHRSIPLYVYGSVEEFRSSIEETVRRTLSQGPSGWQVTDLVVTMTHSDYESPGTTAGDFRKLTPLVLMSALKEAGTVVCEPIHRFHLEFPADALGSIVPALARAHAVPETPAMRGSSCTLDGEIPATRVHQLRQQLPAVTGGEGVLECVFDHYRPIHGTVPTRPRPDPDPLNRKEYLLHVLRRA